MKRRRFITFGSILAVVLTLATIGYLHWLVARKHYRLQFQPGMVKSNMVFDWQLSPSTFLRLFEREARVSVWWIRKGPCYRCLRWHKPTFNCGMNIVTGVWKRPSHVTDTRWKCGPFKYFQSAPGGNFIWSTLECPSWMFIPVLGAYPSLYFLVVGIRRLRRRAGHCLHCDYDLTGNESGVCPECGTAIKVTSESPRTP